MFEDDEKFIGHCSIKLGTRVMQDFRVYEWPQHAGGTAKSPKMKFRAYQATPWLMLRAQGFGGRNGYGCGAVFIDKYDVEWPPDVIDKEWQDAARRIV